MSASPAHAGEQAAAILPLHPDLSRGESSTSARKPPWSVPALAGGPQPLHGAELDAEALIGEGIEAELHALAGVDLRHAGLGQHQLGLQPVALRRPPRRGCRPRCTTAPGALTRRRSMVPAQGDVRTRPQSLMVAGSRCSDVVRIRSVVHVLPRGAADLPVFEVAGNPRPA